MTAKDGGFTSNTLSNKDLETMEFQTAHDYVVGAMGSDENKSPDSLGDNVSAFYDKRRKTENIRKESLLQINSSGNLMNADLKYTQISATKTIKST